jgi:hypothetical protein
MNKTFSSTGAGRRQWLGGGTFGAMLAALGTQAEAASESASLRVIRGRYSLSQDLTLPTANTVTRVPWDVVTFQEGDDFSLLSDGKVRVEKKGLYRIALACDWAGQHGVDIDLRMIGIRRHRPGGKRIPPFFDDRLASVDVPGSDPPQMARWQGTWDPGQLALGAVISTDVAVSPGGVANVGDVALASHDQITDLAIGAAAVNALIMQARVVAPNTVRVTLYNPTVAAGINIPNGMLNVVAMSAVATRGESADAWQVLHTASEHLDLGDMIYAEVKSKCGGDYIQATRTSFLQIERWR